MSATSTNHLILYLSVEALQVLKKIVQLWESIPRWNVKGRATTFAGLARSSYKTYWVGKPTDYGALI